MNAICSGATRFQREAEQLQDDEQLNCPCRRRSGTEHLASNLRENLLLGLAPEWWRRIRDRKEIAPGYSLGAFCSAPAIWN